ncbi:MAG: porin family protein [Bacteroidota bacterium]
MKKFTFLSLVILAFAGKTVLAQDGVDIESKGFRFGLKAEPSIVWIKPEDSKKYESGGARMKFAYGLITEFKLGNTASFVTGLEATYSGGKINFKEDSIYYVTDEQDSLFISSRKFNTTYVGIPIALKMKTPDIGGFTYFGMFGINTAFKTKARSEDVGVLKGTTSETTQTGVDISKDVNFMRFDLKVGGGFEYNLAGTTSLLVSINYHNGLTNVFTNDSKMLRTIVDNASTPAKQDAKSSYISLTVGILF